MVRRQAPDQLVEPKPMAAGGFLEERPESLFQLDRVTPAGKLNDPVLDHGRAAKALLDIRQVWHGTHPNVSKSPIILFQREVPGQYL
jgi:hypothetical protein